MDTAVLGLRNDGDVLELVMLHFLNLKKRTVRLDENLYRGEIEFRFMEELEMVFLLLQFSPVIKVLEPGYVVKEIKRKDCGCSLA